jgi:tetratricopeptide (TPR) repeat protein
MKYFLLLSLSALCLSGCAGTTPVQSQPASNQSAVAPNSGKELSAISHSTENQFPPSKTPETGNMNSAPPSDGGSPMSKPIDVSVMNAAIEKAEKKHQKDPKDAEAAKDLAHAYFVRAFALTEAAQYRAALGDFRKGLKLDPDDEEAKNMHDQIISIFKSIGREPPKEGEEPPPLPFDKPSDKL